MGKPKKDKKDKKEKKEKKKKSKKGQAIVPGDKLEETLDLINTTYGKGTIVRGEGIKYLEVNRISSGIFDFDIKLGGGIPEGRIVIFRGEYSSGKSTVALNVAREFQRLDRITKKPYLELVNGVWREIDFGDSRDPIPMTVAFIDAERSYDPKWAGAWGVNTGEMLVTQPAYAEQAIDICDVLIRSGAVDLIIIDSVASLTAMEEIEKSAESWQRALGARLMNKALRKWTAAMNSGGIFKSASTLLLINQIRQGFASGFSYKTSPGGKGMDHFASIVVEFERSEWIKDNREELIVGLRSGYHIPKNKTAPAMRSGEFAMHFSNDLYQSATTDTVKQVLKAAVFWGLVVKSGAWYSMDIYGDVVKLQGEEALVKYLFDHPVVVTFLAEKVLEFERQWSEVSPPEYRVRKKEDEIQGGETAKALPGNVGEKGAEC